MVIEAGEPVMFLWTGNIQSSSIANIWTILTQTELPLVVGWLRLLPTECLAIV